MKKRIFFLSILVLLLLLTGCSGPKHTAEELKPVLDDLLPRAAEINEIYFGDGLPTNRDENAVRAFYETFDTDIAAISYTPVDPACGYETVDDIRRATLEVFTDTYAETLFDRAFTGISDVFDEGTETEHRTTALYAMYLEQDGFLTKRVDVGRDSIPLGRTYDTGTLTVLRENSTGVEVRLSSFVNGEPSVDVEIWLVETEDGWRIDSPTY
ncbi:MAG: hypothetical protein IIU08_09740 [Clostridia bacterium]|nr:hypothetical protein [Clostridia bacterium]